jgi:hypothetical protein
MVSFVSYVLRFRFDDTALGDVARDMMLDTGINKRWGYTKLISHLIRMNAVDRIYGILEQAKVAYVLLRL